MEQSEPIDQEKLRKRFKARLGRAGRMRVLDIIMAYAEPITEALRDGLKYEEIWQEMLAEKLEVRTYQAFTRALREFREIIQMPSQKEVRKAAGRFLREKVPQREEVLSRSAPKPSGNSATTSPFEEKRAGLRAPSFKDIVREKVQ